MDPSLLVNSRFERLTVISFEGRNKEYRPLLKCICDCGNVIIANYKLLKNGHVKSCGCLKKDLSTIINHKHGCAKDKNTGKKVKLYGVWCSMKERCYNPHSKPFRYYGEKGVTVCAEWVDDFSVFQDWALSNGYNEALSIDRINSNGDYSPENCRWATRITQSRNRSCIKSIEMNGDLKTIPEWSDLTGLSTRTINQRLRRGWESNRILTTKI